MTQILFIGMDLVAISVMTFLIYMPRHHRRDMVLAFLALNIGVIAVASILASGEIGAGLGLGLFGLLSIIRLRSDELSQWDIAYYFAALALGLLGGIPVSPAWMNPALMAAILIVLYIGDHPGLLPGYRVQIMNLDRAYTDEAELIERLQRDLNARVLRIEVRRVDLVNDATTVEVRYQQPAVARPAVAVSKPDQDPL